MTDELELFPNILYSLESDTPIEAINQNYPQINQAERSNSLTKPTIVIIGDDSNVRTTS